MTQEGGKCQESEDERFIPGNLTGGDQDEVLPMTRDTMCGLGPFKWPFLQKFANKNTYVVITGISGAVFISRFAYLYGTISTVERRFKIPSRNIGYQFIGHEIVVIIMSICVTYFAGKGHKPRWIGFGLLATTVSCFLMAIPHFIYGGGNAVSFTVEHGDARANSSLDVVERDRRKDLCNADAYYAPKCDTDEGHLEPQIIFFVAQTIAGIGSALFSSLSSIYMDDNVKKENTPVLISIMYFLGMTGPMLGYALAGFCLKFFIDPSLTPTILDSDPRWVGSWWIGWLVLTCFMFISSWIFCFFPKILPDAAKRKHMAMLKGKVQMSEEVIPASLTDFINSLKRLLTNKIYVLYVLSTLFTIYGAEPYMVYTPKYIESLYQKTPAESNFYTGTIGFIFMGIGTIISGAVVSKFKPSARKIVIWNCVICFSTICCNLIYTQLSCSANEEAFNSNNMAMMQTSCNDNCHCDYVQYSPVCGEDQRTYISPCHAGCSDRFEEAGNTTKVFTNCTCINSVNLEGGSATEGACPIDCQKEFNTFLVVMSFLKLIGATGFASNFVLSVRCVDEKDKAFSLGICIAFNSICAFIPIPVLFGALVDSTCELWGKTCTTSGNCWLYNGPSLRYLLNLSTSFSNTVALCLNIAIVYFAKNLAIFDEEDTGKDVKIEERQKIETTDF